MIPIAPTYVILWVLLAGLAAFVAKTNGRRAWLWFLIGLVPVVGVVLVFAIGEPDAGPEKPEWIEEMKDRRQRGEVNRRCAGYYQPDCHNCPFFRKPQLFGDVDETEAGRCEKLKRTLWKDDARRMRR